MNANKVEAFSVASRIYDTGSYAQVMWVLGSIVLPMGSQIDLHSSSAPHGTATVTGIRLLAGSAK